MDIQVLPAAEAAVLVPLTLQVQALHSADAPDLYVTDPAPEDVAAFLTGWVSDPAVTALIAGPRDAPTGYVIYEIMERGRSVLRHAERRAMLHHLCVDAGHRRQGIARALISAMLARDDVRQSDTMFTSYAAFNAPSAAVMAEMGFRPATIFAARGAGDVATQT